MNSSGHAVIGADVAEAYVHASCSTCRFAFWPAPAGRDNLPGSTNVVEARADEDEQADGRGAGRLRSVCRHQPVREHARHLWI
jgi:hypothetical protein